MTWADGFEARGGDLPVRASRLARMAEGAAGLPRSGLAPEGGCLPASRPLSSSVLPPGARRSRRAGFAAVFTAACAFLLAALPASAQARPGGPAVTCAGYDVPVALAAGQPDTYHVWGELCSAPGELVPGGTVQLLLHGATYDYRYWDFGTADGSLYSYARDVAAAGIPTFAMDQLGSGWAAGLPRAGYSSYPPSADVTIQVAAYAEHQVVQALRSGRVARNPFGPVVEVGHSFGSITSVLEAGTYHDVAGVILTGYAHSDTVFKTKAEPDIHPADGDPLFKDGGIGQGYMTTVPGTRGFLFYNAADSGPRVIARDEATKSTIPLTMFLTGMDALKTENTAAISVPVLIIDGQDDQLFCGALQGGGTYDCSSGTAIAAQEAPYYAPAAQLRTCVVPGSGHDVSLALNHRLEEAEAITWTYEYIGQGPVRLPSRTLPQSCSR